MTKKVLSPQDYMQMAIDEMNKSVNEPRSDGKIPPKVGAVLVFPNGRVERAHRGELREGDHAEFTLLERKLRTENLEDCVLYTTLEPCVERNPPKVPCCRRTTNARIKQVYVGVPDKDPTVDGKGIQHLIDNNVEVQLFDRKFQQIILEENQKFFDQALERKRQSDEKLKLREIEKAIERYDITKLSKEALSKFIEEAGLNFSLEDEDFFDFLNDIGVLKWDEVKNIFEPTGYGVLLFGNDPRAKYPQAVLKAHVTYSGGKVETKDFEGPLVLLPDQIEEWLYKVLPYSKDTTSFKRQDVTDFPISVLREAILNALVHRDYENQAAKCNLRIDDNTIVIESPGEPILPITIKQLNSFNAPSLSRNPIITYVFSKMKYVEERGFGMETFKGINEKHGLPIPQYSIHQPFLRLSFARNTEGLKQLVNLELLAELDEDELKGFEIFREREHVTKSEFVEFTGKPTRSAERMLKRFVDIGLIVSKGAGRGTYYTLGDS